MAGDGNFNCLTCNKQFHRKPYEVKHGYTKFCSRKCHYIYKTKPRTTVLTKICSSCETSLDRSCFYSDTKTPDGLFNTCKLCSKQKWKLWYSKNRERQLSKAREYRKTPEWREVILKSARKMSDKYPQKKICRNETMWARIHGILVESPCEICGSVRVEVHHEDYSDPYKVRWLCPMHHREVHGRVAFGKDAI